MLDRLQQHISDVTHRFVHKERVTPLEPIPGPPAHPILGNIPDFLKHENPWDGISKFVEEYGPIVRIQLGRKPALLLHQPEWIGQVMLHQRHLYHKIEPVDALRPIVTDSNPFIANGADWHHKRKQSFLSRAQFEGWMESQRPELEQLFFERFQSFSEHASIQSFEKQVQKMLFDVLSILTVGQLFEDRVYRDFCKVMKVGDLRMKTSLPLFMPGFFQARKRWFEAFGHLMTNRSKGHAILHVMQKGSPLTREFFRNELANVFPGGLFSLTGALTNAIALVATYPERCIPSDTQQAEGEGNPTSPPSLLYSDAWVEAILRETLRLYPPAPIFSRAVREGTVQLGGFQLPESTRILISPIPLHRSEEAWTQPNTFLPQRWDKKTLQQHSFGSAYFFPFGRGPRACIGQALAMFILRTGLRTFLHHFSATRQAKDLHQQYFFACMLPKKLHISITKNS